MKLRFALFIFLAQLIMGSKSDCGSPFSCEGHEYNMDMKGLWQANYSLPATARVTIDGMEYEAFIGAEDGNEFEVVHEGTTLRFAVVCDDPIVCTAEALGTEFYVNQPEEIGGRYGESQFGIGLPSHECLSERVAEADECVYYLSNCSEMVCGEIAPTNYDQAVSVASDNTFDYLHSDPREPWESSPFIRALAPDICSLIDVRLSGEVTPEGEGSVQQVNNLSATLGLLYPASCFVQGERTPEIEELLQGATVELSQSLTAVRIEPE